MVFPHLLAEECRPLRIWSSKRHPQPGNDGETKKSYDGNSIKVLSPFIDLVIDAKGPKQDLPAEYEDWHPKTLAAFKGRMQAEALWP
jgi:hypothetical protein